MRILGGHDFYDTALAHGRDETLVFVRSPADKARRIKPSDSALRIPKSKTVKFGQDYLSQSIVTHGGIEHTVFPRILWFAGRRHGAMQVMRRGRTTGQYIMDDLWFWDEARFYEFLASIGARLRDPRKGTDADSSINTSNIGSFFTEAGREAEREWLVEHGISIALLDIERFTRDEDHFWRIDSDGLRDIHFQRCVGPYEAFQALSQWVGGVLPRPGADIVTIRDEKTMLSKHGMDKWSFRKPPESA